jgi:hypothetical protein
VGAGIHHVFRQPKIRRNNEYILGKAHAIGYWAIGRLFRHVAGKCLPLHLSHTPCRAVLEAVQQSGGGTSCELP